MQFLHISWKGVFASFVFTFLTLTLLSLPVFSQGDSPLKREIDPAAIDPEFIRKWSYDALPEAARPEARTDRRVRVVYLVPSDREIRAEYVSAIEGAFLNLQEFYRAQIGNGYTYMMHPPIVEVIRTQHTAAWYNTNPNGSSSLWFWNNALTDGFTLSGGRFADPNNRWIYYIDSDNACGQPIGGNGGVALMSANDLRGLSGGSTLVASCPGDPTVSPGVQRWIGGAGHEMGHAFGLPHPPGCGTGSINSGCSGGATAENSLMWVGYASYPNTYLLAENKQHLTNSGFLYNVISINGRITGGGRGLAGAVVRVDSAQGARFAVTNPLGYYRFFDLAWNVPYTLQVTHKRFAFSSRSVTPTANLAGYDITAP